MISAIYPTKPWHFRIYVKHAFHKCITFCNRMRIQRRAAFRAFSYLFTGKMVKNFRQNGKMATHTSVANKKRILRLKYLRSKYRLELWAGCKSNILHRNAQLFVRQFCEHTAQSVPSGGKLW